MTPIESLPAKWRNFLASAHNLTFAQICMRDMARDCADQLEAALAAQPKDGELLALADDLRNGGLSEEPTNEFLRGLRAGKRHAADMIESLASRRVEVDAYAAGWHNAAKWANRDDLIADIGSPAYERDKAAALQPDSGEDGSA